MAFEILLKDVAILARDPMPYSYMILVEMEEDTRGVVRLGMPRELIMHSHTHHCAMV